MCGWLVLASSRAAVTSLVAEQSVREGQQVLRAVAHALEHEFRITHATIQVEVEGCAADDMYCMGLHAGDKMGRRQDKERGHHVT